MPGETLSFKVTAVDQAGNLQPAIWSIAESDEDKVEREVLSVENSHTIL